MGDRARAWTLETFRLLWAMRHRRDRRLRAIVRRLLRADVARLRELQRMKP
jgi:hypothetical protein